MSTTTPSRVAAVRAFNRFYTRRLGMLGNGLLGTAHPLPQARVLYELGQRPVTAVADLRAALDLDAGYLSRLLTSLEDQDLVTRKRSDTDARRQEISLTDKGTAAYAQLDERSKREIHELLERLTDHEQRRVLAAMHALEDAWDQTPVPRRFTLRAPRAGELGWVIERHGALYEREYGFDHTFEALVAKIVAGYAEGTDTERERAWIADVAGEPAGCVFCMRKDDATAQLRLLLVEPDARGMGIGARLVEQCVQFAEQAGYTSMTLWTQSILEDAVRLYERAGFRLAEQEQHRSFSRDLVGQTWFRELSPRSRT
ncbi:MAG TPA: helix-turn-helix domain-containing GNAT family N-acetyltransferase [Solirubrobacteraceae bacterium]|nr:helix-turn-helix domain-containing GNAT family N-acetyltransferase [Solirubrobacteraceae bacterium]